MSETANYGLYITDDNSTKFLEWRTKMNGTGDSNMVKIDAALAQKADASKIVSAVLSAAKWTGSVAPFTQTLQIQGLTAGQNGVIDVAQNITEEQLQAACDANLRMGEQRDGALAVLAKREKPTLNIPVTIILFG